MILTFIETREKKIRRRPSSSCPKPANGGRPQDRNGRRSGGDGMEGLAPELASCGASQVYLLENASLDRYSTQTMRPSSPTW